MFGPRLTRVAPDGTKETIAEIAGGPNGAGRRARRRAVPVQQRRLLHAASSVGGMLVPGPVRSATATSAAGSSASILSTGDGHRPLHRVRRPAAAGAERPRVRRRRRLLVHRPRHPRPRPQQRPDEHLLRQGRRLVRSREVVYPGRSAERHRPVARRSARCTGPRPTPAGVPTHRRRPGRAGAGRAARSRRVCLAGLPGFQLLDSLAVDGDGNVCVATLVNGGSPSSRPTARSSSTSPTGDLLTTNICFGGPDGSGEYATPTSRRRAPGGCCTCAGRTPASRLNYLPEHGSPRGSCSARR